jgi:WhiB family transcriptional regulator, redox-sensing transcriptional regulator
MYGAVLRSQETTVPAREEVAMADLTRLPGPNADLWDWQLRSACRHEDPDLFFHPDGERGPAREDRDRAAKLVCATCPVLASCRAHALRVREPYGVWGGLSEDEREAVLLDGTRVAVG